jgi:hypothetical protein
MKLLQTSLSLVALTALMACGSTSGPSDRAHGTAAQAESTGADAGSNVVEFHVKDGTGQGAWNTQDKMVEVKVGQILRLINDDSVAHRLHTDDGIPCNHGDEMDPQGGQYDCVIKHPYDSATDGPLHDHDWDESVALFWVKAAAK